MFHTRGMLKMCNIKTTCFYCWWCGISRLPVLTALDTVWPSPCKWPCQNCCIKTTWYWIFTTKMVEEKIPCIMHLAFIYQSIITLKDDSLHIRTKSESGYNCFLVQHGNKKYPLTKVTKRGSTVMYYLGDIYKARTVRDSTLQTTWRWK